MRIQFFYLVLLLIFSQPFSLAENHKVDSADAIVELIESNSLTAGDVIIWSNGVYKDQEMELNGIHGAEGNPITLRAETPGGVILRGESMVRTNGSWLVIEGFHFDGSEGGPSAYNAIQFRGSGDVGAEHVRLTNCAFTSLDNGEATAKWVQMYGRFNRVDHCHFSSKPNKGALLTVELDGLTGDQTAEHVIECNYFADVAANEGSDNETIRVGYSGDQNRSARCVIQRNVFLRCNGENEVVSNKSSFNRYTANVFRACNGSLVLRHGHHVTVNGNFFLGDGAKDAGGIRVNDSHHRIYNNYMQDLTGLTWNAALSIEGGKKASGGDSSGYQAVDDLVVVHNSIVNCAKSIYLSDKHGKRTPTGVMANNLVAVDDEKKTLVDPQLATDGLKWTENLFWGADSVADLPGLKENPQLVATQTGFRIKPSSPLIGGAQGEFDFVAEDFENQPRGATKDIGADEFLEGDAKKEFPFTELEAKVGVSFLDRAE